MIFLSSLENLLLYGFDVFLGTAPPAVAVDGVLVLVIAAAFLIPSFGQWFSSLPACEDFFFGELYTILMPTPMHRTCDFVGLGCSQIRGTIGVLPSFETVSLGLPLFCACVTESHCVTLAGTIFLPLPPEGWDYKHTSDQPAWPSFTFFNTVIDACTM